MKAFLKFNKGIMKMPVHWRMWLMLLVGANMIAPMFFLNRLEAQITLAIMLVNMVLMTLLTARFGFTRILALGHILWIPLLAFMFLRLGSIPEKDTFGIWIRVLIALNGLSIVFDTSDVARYIAGDREETVQDL